MAKRTVTRLVDDVDGSEASETITFGLDGRTFEIDLNEDNARELRDALAPYVSVATETTPRGRRRPTPTRTGRAADRQRLADIRAWAHENGYHVSGRGRIPAHIVAAYEAAH